MSSYYRLFVNEERTVLFRIWAGAIECALRPTPAHTWGPPITLLEERNGVLVQPTTEEVGQLAEGAGS
jgi:hypothetical protein